MGSRILKRKNISTILNRRCMGFSEEFLKDCHNNLKELWNPPSEVQGMKMLDREKFKRKIVLPHAIFYSYSNGFGRNQLLRHHFPQISNLYLNSCKLHMIFRLNSQDNKPMPVLPGIYMDIFTEFEKDELYVCGIKTFEDKEVELDYTMFTQTQILDAVLPKECRKISQEKIGNIIMLWPKKEHLPYLDIISKVILDCSPEIKTITRKNVKDDLNIFKMECLAGQPNFCAMINLHHATYYLDIRDVHFHTHPFRLYGENSLEIFTPKTDVFCASSGVGEKIFPLISMGCNIFANETNYSAYRWLLLNSKTNEMKAQISNVTPYEFVIHNFKNYLTELPNSQKFPKNVVLNLSFVANVWEILHLLKELLSVEYETPPFRLRIVFNQLVESNNKTFEERVPEKDEMKLKVEELFGIEIKEIALYYQCSVTANQDNLFCDFILPNYVLYSKKSVND